MIYFSYNDYMDYTENGEINEVKRVEEDIAKYELSDINPGTWYEVIDGQQRLTTIYLIIKFLNIYTLGKTVELINLPNLFYETRK